MGSSSRYSYGKDPFEGRVVAEMWLAGDLPCGAGYVLAGTLLPPLPLPILDPILPRWRLWMAVSLSSIIDFAFRLGQQAKVWGPLGTTPALVPQ